MFVKFKNLFFVSIAMIFSVSQAHAECDCGKKKNPNHFFKISKFAKKNKLKDKKLSSNFQREKNSIKKQFRSSLKNSNRKILPAEIPLEIKLPLDCDIIFTEMEVGSKILKSEYGHKMIWHLQNMVENLNNLYQDTVCDLDFKIDLPLNFYFFDQSYINLDLNFFYDLQKIFLSQSYLYKNDIQEAERVAFEIKTIWLKNGALEDIFDEYLIRNQIQDAQRIYSMMEFNFEDEDEEYDFSEITDELVVALMRNNEFQKAEEIAFNISDEFYRDYDLTLIVKYYTRKADIQNAQRIIESISDYSKNEAKLFIVDYFAREKKIIDFQKVVLSSDDEDFKLGANFILNIYQNNFEEAQKNMPYDYEDILYNIAEILVSQNRIAEAEYLVNYFGDDYDIKDMQLFFINAYLKKGQIDEAKKVKDEMEESIDKIVASKLIIAYTNG